MTNQLEKHSYPCLSKIKMKYVKKYEGAMVKNETYYNVLDKCSYRALFALPGPTGQQPVEMEEEEEEEEKEEKEEKEEEKEEREEEKGGKKKREKK
ncbi:hypothetical protein FQN53_007276 [Emmonsiellopsis sp. PD_33]|nr:hypothetical protein FQN53_007276 [Emmonsiellopsis sp. PD_33]